MQTCKYIPENGNDGGPDDKQGTQILPTMVWLLNFTNANVVLRLPTITTEARVPLPPTFSTQKPPLGL